MSTINYIQSFDAYMREYVSETVSQEIAKFNAASGGAIVLAGVTTEGSYKINSFVKDIRSAARYRRDPSSTASQSATAYQEGTHIAVKVAGGFSVSIPDAVLMWAGEGEPSAEIAQAMQEIAIQYAEAVIQDQLNTIVAAAGAAIEANTSVTSDVSTTSAITMLGLNGALKLFGDRGTSIVAWVCHSGAYYALTGEALSNSNNLYEIGGVMITSALNRIIVVTDAPALAYENGATTDVYKVLGLVPGALQVTEPKQITAMNKETGNQNISTEWRANYDFMCQLLGYSWDTTAGGEYPTDTEIATGTNWDKIATSNKNTAGVCLIGAQVAP